ncbi:MFS transporter [Kitasatospora sp. NPDC015120]|uniref:MFS transporter n=1 Tax=Kitasatospora sp. NPDC015120 TaxID=3364023 RepID=UPI0036F4A3C4
MGGSARWACSASAPCRPASASPRRRTGDRAAGPPGAAGALLQPATLGLLRAAYPAELLGRAIALRTSAIGLSAAAGPLVGGFLTAQWGWRSVFCLTVAPAVAAGVAAPAVRLPAPGTDRAVGGGAGRRRHPHRHPAGRPRRRARLPGAALLGGAPAGPVSAPAGLAEQDPAPGGGPGLRPWHGFAAAGVLGALFVRRERRTPDPLLPPAVLRAPAVAPAPGVLLTASAALSGPLFLATYVLQDVLAPDPPASALRALPLALAMVAAAPATASPARRHGPRRTVVAGMSSITLGALGVAALRPGTPALPTGAAFLLLGAGSGAVLATATAALVRAVPAAHAGVAGGSRRR